jgi:hypothetical protein
MAQDGNAAATETIVLLRHGEKPDAGLGQLNCQGLNRSLALPAVIAKIFGRPDAIFAPNPSDRKEDDGTLYDYVRPLETIEPTAISLGLPVNTGFGFVDVNGLRTALEQPAYRGALVLIAWEHTQAAILARDLLAAHGSDPAVVPEWHGRDFDSLYVIRIVRTGTTAAASFEHMHEGLDGQPPNCPRSG